MKIYTEILIDMTKEDLPVIKETYFNYVGPVAKCGEVGEFFGDVAEDIGGFVGDITGGLVGGLSGGQTSGEARRQAQQQVGAGTAQSVAEQRAATERALGILSPFSEFGRQQIAPFQQFTAQAAPLSTQALRSLGQEALAPPGLSRGEQFRLTESERALGRLQAARGSLFSGRAGEELLQRGAERITGESEARRLGLLGGLSGLYPSLAQNIIGRGQQAGGTAAQIAQAGGAGIGSTLFGGATQQAGLQAQQGGLFGRDTGDIMQLLNIGSQAAPLIGSGLSAVGGGISSGIDFLSGLFPTE